MKTMKVVRNIGGTPTEVTIQVDPTKKEFEKYYKANTMWCKCATCNNCRLFIDGPYQMSCVNGGPYVGYSDEAD
jgi:hypothetical protein